MKRANKLKQQREKEKHEMLLKKQKLESDFDINQMGNAFTTKQELKDHDVTSETVGLVTLDELKAQQEAQLNKDKEEKAAEESKVIENKKDSKVEKNLISFNYDDEENSEDEEEKPVVIVKKKRFGVNPTVDTSYIPDIYRNEEENILREQLKQEYMQYMSKVKEQTVKIAFSYWDGSGHRREVTVKRGNTVQIFLTRCLEQLRMEFSDLRSVTVDRLMFIKQDLIIPHHYTLHELANAINKSGGLMFEDLIIKDNCASSDATANGLCPSQASTDISAASTNDTPDIHDGKVCLRSWYDRNKHIFPANRWTAFDPVKNFQVNQAASSSNTVVDSTNGSGTSTVMTADTPK